MNTKTKNSIWAPLDSKTLRLTACAVAMATAFALAGCSGSDDSGSGGGAASKTVQGTLLDSASAPLVGETVIYDQGSAGSLTTTTDASGRYRFSVAPSAVTGSDTVSFYDSTGHLLGTAPVVPDGSAVTTTIAPPPPPTTGI